MSANDELAGRMARMDMARARPAQTVFPPRSTDNEASAILDDLSKLQSMLVLQMRRGPEWIAAADLIQRTRVLIIERCKRPASPPAFMQERGE